jgi:transposase
MKTRQPYPTDLTDKEWELIKHLVPEAKPGGRPEEYPKREVLNGIFYLLRTGCAWRMLPHDLPPWRIVYYYFGQWRKDGTWQRIHDLLRGAVRIAAGRRRQPSAGIIASQSIKTTAKGGSAAMMPASRSTGANGISSSIRWASCSPWSSPLPVCKTGMAPRRYWKSSGTISLACG